MLSSRTGQPLARLNLTKPANWMPNAAAAAQLFKSTPATAEPPGIDTSGLPQLLLEDLLAAAAQTDPAMLTDSIGAGSLVAKILSSLPVSGAPTKVSYMLCVLHILWCECLHASCMLLPADANTCLIACPTTGCSLACGTSPNSHSVRKQLIALCQVLYLYHT